MTEKALPDIEPALLRQLQQLRAGKARMHHVVDLASGRVVSTRGTSMPSVAVRRRRLAALGHVFETTIFGGPRYRLSPRRPYQASPEAWLHSSSEIFFTTETDEIAWSGDPLVHHGFLQCHFAEVPQGKCLASFDITARPRSGATGHIRFQASGTSVRIPISQEISHLIEIVFDPPGTAADAGFIIEAGVQVVIFRSMTLAAAPLILTPD